MKSWWGAILCGWLCGAALAADPAPTVPAARLAAAMRLDEFLARLTNQLAASANQRQIEAPDPVPCLLPFRSEEFRQDAPRVLDALFTQDEMTRALKFYRSAEGRRYVEFTFAFLDGRAAGRQPEFALTSQERASVKAFKRTRAGAIMASPLRIAGSNAAKQILRQQYATVPSRCPAPERA